MRFHPASIWLLALLFVVPLLIWWGRRSRGRSPLAYGSLDVIGQVGATWAARLHWLPSALRLAALALLIVALARPQHASARARVFTDAVAIQLIVDRSGSMLATDFEVDSRAASRLQVVKRVVQEFVIGGDRLPGRPDDLIGLITFATSADSVCPLTLDHDHLVNAVRQTEVSPSDQDRATAIGDAIALGVERLRTVQTRKDATQIKSAVMILLTDGESNAGDIDPLTAADIASVFGIKIYTIGAGTSSGLAPMPGRDPFTGRTVTRAIPVSIDEATLKEIARRTGGQYFRATDRSSLEDVYARIDELERTTVEEERYADYRELAVESVTWRGLRWPALLALVVTLLAIETLLAATRFRTVP